MEYIYTLIRKNKFFVRAVIICGIVIFQGHFIFSQERIYLELTYDKTDQLVLEYMPNYYSTLITYDKAGNRMRKLTSDYIDGIIEVENNIGILKIYPVPSSEEISVSFTLQNSSNIDFSIFSIDGKLRYKTREYIYAGDNIYKFNISELTSGPYILELISDMYSSRKIFIIK